jgi:hypothetical protein
MLVVNNFLLTFCFFLLIAVGGRIRFCVLLQMGGGWAMKKTGMVGGLAAMKALKLFIRRHDAGAPHVGWVAAQRKPSRRVEELAGCWVSAALQPSLRAVVARKLRNPEIVDATKILDCFAALAMTGHYRAHKNLALFSASLA